MRHQKKRKRNNIHKKEKEMVIMRYAELVSFYEKIEAVSSRISMTNYLVDLFKSTHEDIIYKVVYLTEGKLYPEFVGIELGIAEKMALRALSMATGISQDKVDNEYKKKGDIGIITENLLKTKLQTTLFKRDLDVKDVYDDLDKIARTSGSGSADTKIKILSGLLTDASPKEAKYIMRIVTGKMRLGIADMTIIDALSQAFAGGRKGDIEKIYNMTSDLGDIAKVLSKDGMEGIKEYHAKVGIPIRMMLAQRLNSVKEILEKTGMAICDYKYDGERVQIHKNGNKIELFSRNLKNITGQYPDITAFTRQNLKVNDAIVEGECVAVDTDTGYMLPFQELMKRRRKHGIEEKAEEFPVNVYLFDALLIDGEDITNLPLIKRRNILKNSVTESNGLRLAHAIISKDIIEVEKFFESAIENGCEGLILKDERGTYQAGARGWSWIKLKRSYQAKIVEPIDVVIVGAFMGRGKRSGNYGALLVAVYDHDKDIFSTVSKVGSGFTDQELVDIPKMLEEYKLDRKDVRVDSIIDADVWFSPKIVMEIIGDELTLSPIHPCGLGKIRENAGIAVRFPRFMHNWRYDKGAEDATSVAEIVGMYNAQLKKIE
jgi:DNA ligase-1